MQSHLPDVRPIASRLWAPHFNAVQPAAYRLPADELRVLGENNWVKRQPLAWLIGQCLPSVERLHFAGGEPLIMPEMIDVLQQCIHAGRAREIELSYNTNLTVLPEKVTALWPHFRRVSLLCSVDGYGRLNDYIRRPSHWSDIDRNLRLVDRHFDKWNIRWAALSAVVQIYNVLAIRELFAYMRKARFTHILPIPQLVPLFEPRIYPFKACPRRPRVSRERGYKPRSNALRSGIERTCRR